MVSSPNLEKSEDNIDGAISVTATSFFQFHSGRYGAGFSIFHFIRNLSFFQPNAKNEAVEFRNSYCERNGTLSKARSRRLAAGERPSCDSILCRAIPCEICRTPPFTTCLEAWESQMCAGHQPCAHLPPRANRHQYPGASWTPGSWPNPGDLS